MPYKHIAAQLKKTELACRLHYHQLSFGSKARRSAAACHSGVHHGGHSMHERSSLTPQPPSFRHSPPQQRPLPSFSPPDSPPNTIQPPNSSAMDLSHKPILPKPNASPFVRASTSSPRGLKLVTDDLSTRDNRIAYVDINRLDRLYDAHRLHFWSGIAAEYGGNLSPATLEDAWRRSHSLSNASNFPPTPRGSPQSSLAEPQPNILTTPFSAMTDPGKFTAVNKTTPPPPSWREREGHIPRSTYQTSSSASSSNGATSQRNGGMSVNSLLTENREVRSPGKEKTSEEAMEVDSTTSQREASVTRESATGSPAVLATVPESKVSPVAVEA